MPKIYIGYQGELPVRVELTREVIENDKFLHCDRIVEHTGRAELVNGKVLLDDAIDVEKNKLATDARITELQTYLSSTDWYAIRYADSGEPMPEEVRAKRAEARLEISQLRGSM